MKKILFALVAILIAGLLPSCKNQVTITSFANVIEHQNSAVSPLKNLGTAD
ncbi:hypothetical protein [Mucilaginibacter pallidiroseus]|uniref:hypothetical protein n=1 Tax=Mucilaginibacter pallidiroseus TaxID=2599295 RepID=UPI0016482CAA|nr:hypothetical protein [Mucilaginibacter pallidiroseus]